MPQEVILCDVTLRDGEQTAGVAFSLEEKVIVPAGSATLEFLRFKSVVQIPPMAERGGDDVSPRPGEQDRNHDGGRVQGLAQPCGCGAGLRCRYRTFEYRHFHLHAQYAGRHSGIGGD